MPKKYSPTFLWVFFGHSVKNDVSIHSITLYLLEVHKSSHDFNFQWTVSNKNKQIDRVPYPTYRSRQNYFKEKVQYRTKCINRVENLVFYGQEYVINMVIAVGMHEA